MRFRCGGARITSIRAWEEIGVCNPQLRVRERQSVKRWWLRYASYRTPEAQANLTPVVHMHHVPCLPIAVSTRSLRGCSLPRRSVSLIKSRNLVIRSFAYTVQHATQYSTPHAIQLTPCVPAAELGLPNWTLELLHAHWINEAAGCYCHDDLPMNCNGKTTIAAEASKEQSPTPTLRCHS